MFSRLGVFHLNKCKFISQGGFVLQEKSPAPSSCAVNCSNAPEPFITCLLNETFPPLSERLASSNCDPSTCAGPYQGSLPENCSFLEWHGIFSGRLEQCLNRNIPVDSIIGLVTDETPPPGYEVTVWYNNQVDSNRENVHAYNVYNVLLYFNVLLYNNTCIQCIIIF